MKTKRFAFYKTAPAAFLATAVTLLILLFAGGGEAEASGGRNADNVYVFSYKDACVEVLRERDGERVFSFSDLSLETAEQLRAALRTDNGGSEDYRLDIGEPLVRIAGNLNPATAPFDKYNNAFTFSASASHPLEKYAHGSLTAGDYKWTFARKEAAEETVVAGATGSALSFGAGKNGGGYKITASVSYFLNIFDRTFSASSQSVTEIEITQAGNFNYPYIDMRYGQKFSGSRFNQTSIGYWIWSDDVDKTAFPSVGEYIVHADFIPYDEENYAAEVKVPLKVTITPRQIRVGVSAATSVAGKPSEKIDFRLYPWSAGISDLVGEDTVESLGISFSGWNTAVPGIYEITGSVANPNYDLIFINAEDIALNPAISYPTPIFYSVLPDKLVYKAKDGIPEVTAYCEQGFPVGSALAVVSKPIGAGYEGYEIYGRFAATVYDGYGQEIAVNESDKNIRYRISKLDGNGEFVRFAQSGGFADKLYFGGYAEIYSSGGIDFFVMRQLPSEGEENWNEATVVFAVLAAVLGAFVAAAYVTVRRRRR